MSAELPPPGPPGPPVPPPGPPPGPVNPYAGESRSRYHWAAILAGLVLGFVGWVFGSFVVILGTNFGMGMNRTADVVVPWFFLALVAVAVGLIAWPRSRPLGKGFLLGSAIGVVVAGGLCVPIVFSA